MLVIVVPEAEAVVSAFRERYAARSAARIPAHITLLVPYVPAERLDGAAIEAAREHIGQFAPFDAERTGVGRFAEHVWLAQSPTEVFAGLIRATCRRFPESSYGAEFPEPVPHLTIGEASGDVSVEEIVRAAECEIAPQLPVRFRVSAASLLVEHADGKWLQGADFGFGA